MSFPPSDTPTHPSPDEPQESPERSAAVSNRAFCTFGRLLILLALSLIACSPNLTPAPTTGAGATQPQAAPNSPATSTAPALFTAATSQLSPHALGQRTKTSGYVSVNALPDPDCNPGAIFPDATSAQICVPGYSSSVRDVPTSEKDQVYAEYGISTHAPGQYEVDHLISLELGGSNDIANLWPEPADPRPGFHEKDQVENWLHDQVCSGAIPLADAQIGIARNWLQFYGQARIFQGGSSATLPPLLPATAAPAANGHRYVASSQAKTYYYCDTDPAWHSLSQKNLVWSDDPNTFIAKGLVLHRPC